MLRDLLSSSFVSVRDSSSELDMTEGKDLQTQILLTKYSGDPKTDHGNRKHLITGRFSCLDFEW